MIVSEPLSLVAANAVQRAQTINEGPWTLVGAHGPPALALLLSSQPLSLASRPQVVVFANDRELESFVESLKFFDPNREVLELPAFDVGIYSSLYPNQKTVAGRLRWLHEANSSPQSKLFVATVEALAQQTLPFEVFNNLTASFKKGDSLPDDLSLKLEAMGYHPVPTVEDVGGYSLRGGIVDIFSPAQKHPVRIELLGQEIESIRLFDAETQRSLNEISFFDIIPARESLYLEQNLQTLIQKFSASCDDRELAAGDIADIKRSLSLQQPFYGIDFLLPFFYNKLSSPIEFFGDLPQVWLFNSVDLYHSYDELAARIKVEHDEADTQVIRPPYTEFYKNIKEWPWPNAEDVVPCETIDIEEAGAAHTQKIEFKTFPLTEFSKTAASLVSSHEKMANFVGEKFTQWLAAGYRIFVAAHNQGAAQRLKLLLENAGLNSNVNSAEDFRWHTHLEDYQSSDRSIPIFPRQLAEGFRLPEDHLIYISDADIFGAKRARRRQIDDASFMDRAQILAFGDLKPGDFVVHKLHGVGIYDGLQVMQIEGVPAEFIQLRYKDNDRLYLPVYRVNQLQKYSGPTSSVLVDKLGGPGWSKTTSKVKKQVRDLAATLLKLYAARAQATRPPFSPIDEDFRRFEDLFPYDETDDQLRAIHEVLGDMSNPKPMDRLICGDVGFGKTEVALRAAFKAVQDGKQVAIIAPTTILTFQHTETFKRRFKSWPVEIRTLNRFVSNADVKKTLVDLKAGKVDIVIGTHRLLSKDIEFSRLGLLIVDEEQKFGVAHKERIRQMRESIDTLVLSATPIPRTLNMSLVGLRDISIINTPPEDRLPTRTFMCKFDGETIKKAVMSEIQRGGQIFYLHNRIQSIYELSDQLRKLLPDVRMAVAHGQMPEDELEKTMLKFFNHELDMLLCTAIIESGMDIPRANTIFIDRAHQFGVSQLYQLRGRVGRSKERAYCYLIIPSDKRLDSDAQERLRIIQENTALGSGIKVAHYDLELRGSGDILGAEQSGHINSVGYEMYLELLDEAIREQKGEDPGTNDVDPEINLRIPAFIPDNYIPDIRVRLSYYKALSTMKSVEDLDRVEDELRDQFGALPDSVMNLMGLMLIRKVCRDLGIKDISAGSSWLSLSFTSNAKLPPTEVIRLTGMENKKYAISPDHKFKIRMKDITWPRVHEELEFLVRLCPTS